MRKRRERPVTFCNRCNQMKVEGKMLVGLGWTTCECDVPKSVVDNNSKPSDKPKNVEPFIPKFD